MVKTKKCHESHIKLNSRPNMYGKKNINTCAPSACDQMFDSSVFCNRFAALKNVCFVIQGSQRAKINISTLPYYLLSV